MSKNVNLKVGDHKAERNMDINQLSHKVIGAAIEVHRHLGPGLLESAYRDCLAFEISQAGLFVEREKVLPTHYKGITLDQGYRIDLVVEGKLVLELKTVEDLTDVHQAQVLTYLKLGNYPLSLLINFHSKILKNGLRRVIHSNFESFNP